MKKILIAIIAVFGIATLSACTSATGSTTSEAAPAESTYNIQDAWDQSFGQSPEAIAEMCQFYVYDPQTLGLTISGAYDVADPEVKSTVSKDEWITFFATKIKNYCY